MENADRVYSHISEHWSLSNFTEESEDTQFIEEDVLEPTEWHSTDKNNPLPGEPTTEFNRNLYGEQCPYRRDELFKFRLIEVFSDGSIYTGDSFGDHSYIDADERRGCLAPCLCNQHDSIPEAFAFVAYKSSGQLAIAIHSRDLYSELISILGFEELYVEGTDQANIVNGLALLKNYSTLKVYLNAIQSNPRVLGSLVLEMMLLIDGVLADGEIFKSYGYEDLYENGFLTYDHWKEFQQGQLERDISALERSYNEIDHNLDCGEESPMPLAQADFFGQEAREVQPDDLNISDQPIVEFGLSRYPFQTPYRSKTRKFLIKRYSYGPDEDLDAYAQSRARDIKRLYESIRQYRLDFLIADENNSSLEGLVRFLRDHGAATNGRDESIGSYSEIFASLNWGYDLCRDLEYAVTLGDQGSVRSLLRNGADAKVTALSIMRRNGRQSMIRFYRSPVLREALAAQKSGFENTCPLQYYTERRQRLQVLHEKFGEQNLKLKIATAQSATSFRKLGDTLKDHRKAWAYGITTLRRLCQGKVRHDLAHTVAFLCLSKAISEAIDKNDTCENSTDFFQDLDRWQILFETDAASLDAYKEAVRLTWGIELNQRVNSSEKACQLETLVYFQALASALVNQTRELLTYPCNPNRKGLESSQDCWRQRFSEESSTSENKYGIFGSQSSGRTSTRVLEAKDPEPPDSQYPDRAFSDPQPPDSQPPDPQFPDPRSPQKESILRERVNRDISSAGICSVVAVLMAGAIFAIVLLFLKWLRDTSSRVSYYSAVAVSFKEIQTQQVDVRHAADSIINRLQQTAPTFTYAIAKLKHHLGQVLKQSRVTCFSMLKRAFAGCTSSSKLGCTETEAVVIQQIIQQTCDYYEPVYALQEKYRNLESYMNMRDRIIIVPRSPPSSTLVAVPAEAGLNTPDVAGPSYPSPNLEAQSPREGGGQTYTSPSFCQDCQRDFRNVSNFNKHRRDKHDRVRYYCRYCTKNYSRKSPRDAHETAKHSAVTR